MNVVLVPDKFKGSLTASEVIQAMQKGLRQIDPSIQTFPILASDGGDGFLNVIRHYLNPQEIICETVDPLGRHLHAPYLFDTATKTAYIELAQASGLELLAKPERQVMETSTYGTGLQLKHAIANGATKLYTGLGGSATNDAGIGIATALGYEFYTGTEKIKFPKGKDLMAITDLDCSAMEHYEGISFFAVNDVQNPLFGKMGLLSPMGDKKVLPIWSCNNWMMVCKV